MIRVKVFSGRILEEGINIALKERLYVSGWALSQSLVGHRRCPSFKEKLAILEKNGKPVAVGWFDGHTVMAFCKKDERRNGYASKCVKALNLERPHFEEGIDGSYNFWRAVGLLK